MAKTVNKATFRQKLAIYNLLANWMKTNEDGTAEYTEGWTDERIAKNVEGATIAHVSGIRRSEFGNFPVAHRGNVSSMQNRIEELEIVVTNLIKCNHELTQKHDKLCQSLSINKVLDARHLVCSPAANGNNKTGIVEKHV